MNTATEHNNSSNIPQSISFNLANTIRDIISDPTLTQGASRLLVQLVLSAGRKGWTWFLIETLGVLVKTSRTQVKVYLKELVDKNRIKIVHRPGRSSVYQIVGIYNQSTKVGRFSGHIKQSYKTKSNVIEKPNGVSVLPSQETKSETSNPRENQQSALHTKTHEKPSIKVISNKPIRMDIVREILDITRDTKSIGCWIKFVRSAPLPIVYCAIASLKSALEEGQVCHPGKYLTGIIKNIYPEMFEPQKHALRPSQDKSEAPYYSKHCENEPPVEVNWQVNKENLRRIQEMLDTKSSHNQGLHVKI